MSVSAEIYPTFCRSVGNAIATSVNWIFNLIISLTFLQLSNAITREGERLISSVALLQPVEPTKCLVGAFFLYAGITVIGWVVFFFTVPETKDKSLEELEHIFNKPLCGSVFRKKSISP